MCRRCFGSPILAAAGIDADVPHGVQHGLSTRMKTIIDAAVTEYTDRNLPLLQKELAEQARRNRARSYRPGDDLAPEYDGLPLDPEPVPGSPFLFTLAELADDAARDLPPLPPLSEDAKAALRREVALSDEYANIIGQEICSLLLRYRLEVQQAIATYVEPQVAAILDELSQALDAPFDPDPR